MIIVYGLACAFSLIHLSYAIQTQKWDKGLFPAIMILANTLACFALPLFVYLWQKYINSLLQRNGLDGMLDRA